MLYDKTQGEFMSAIFNTDLISLLVIFVIHMMGVTCRLVTGLFLVGDTNAQNKIDMVIICKYLRPAIVAQVIDECITSI